MICASMKNLLGFPVSVAAGCSVAWSVEGTSPGFVLHSSDGSKLSNETPTLWVNCIAGV